MAQFLLEISTPEKTLLNEMVDMVVVPSFDGVLGISAGHDKIILALVSGVLRVKKDGHWRAAACSSGYAIVYGEKAAIMVQSAEWPGEIDEERAMQALGRAEHRLEGEESHRDRALSIAARDRAKARLKLVAEIKSGEGHGLMNRTQI